MADRPDSCPLCGMVHMEPRPSLRVTYWNDECACSDNGKCMAHQIDSSDAPNRPDDETMRQRAGAQANRKRDVWKRLMDAFNEYRSLNPKQ